MASRKSNSGQPTLNPSQPTRKRPRPSPAPPVEVAPPTALPDPGDGIEPQLRALFDQLRAIAPNQGNPAVQRVGNSCTLTWTSSLTITLGPTEPDPSEEQDSGSSSPKSALELASLLLQHPVEWLKTPNTNIGDRRPFDLLGTDEEDKVYNMLNAFQHGMFS